MKKIIISVLLVMMLVLTLASCSDDKAKPSDRDSTDAKENTETADAKGILEMWNAPYQYDDLSVFITLEDSDYLGLPYTVVTYEITDEDIQLEIQKLLEEHAIYTDVTDRAADEGDVVNIDYKGSIDGVAFEGGADQGEEFVLGEGNFIPGFQEGIFGHKAGETFVVDVTFPEDYGVETLDGKTAQFEMVLNSVKSVSYPTLTDDFIKENTDYDTVTEYYTATNEKLVKQSEASAKVQQKNELFALLCQNVEFLEYPEAEYNEYRTVFVSQYEEYAKQYGMEFEDFITNAAGSSVEEFNKYADDYAAESVKMELAFFAVAEKIDLLNKLTENDYNVYLENIASEYNQTPEDFLAMYGEDAVYRSLVWDSVMDYILLNGVAQ